MLTKAHMPAVPEAHMAVGLAVEAEFERRPKHGLVAVGGRIGQIKPIALGNLLTGQRAVGGGVPDELLHRAGPPNSLLHESRNEPGVFFELGK